MKQSFSRVFGGRPGFAAVILLGLLVGCNRGSISTTDGQATSPPEEAPLGRLLLEDVTSASGIAFTYKNGEEADHMAILESLGGGAALLDYDGDGFLDIFLPGGGYYGGDDKKQILGHPWKLFRNQGKWKFQDVTAEAGLDGPTFYTHGCAAADYDRDGWPDLLVTGWGRLGLFHNESDGKGGRRFAEVSEKAGLTGDVWSSSAAWADLDGDGYPDLYVCSYVDWSFARKHPTDCTYDGKTRDVCPPRTFEPLPHRLYHNQGNGTFREVGKAAGLRVPREEADYAQLRHLNEEARKRLRDADQPGVGKEYGKGLGVIIADVNADGRPDIYVANDTVDNFLYMNRSRKGQILLEEVGFPVGVARDDRGGANGSMGLAVGDYDGSGRASLFVTNYESEKHALYHNECEGGREFFLYRTQASGIAAIGQTYVGWGTAFVDLDLDGWLDLFIVNGHAIRYPKGAAARRQRPLLLGNTAEGSNLQRRRFVDISRRGGSYFQGVHCARGVAFGDLDNDGRLDMVVSHLNEPVVVLRGAAPPERHWLGVQLERKDHACVVGARVSLEAGGQRQTRFAKGGGSYASASDPRHVFGLGATDKVGNLTVTWPDGQEQTWEGLAVDRYWTLTEGEKEAK